MPSDLQTKKGYSTLGNYARGEYEEKKSRFIASASPVDSADDAIAFINRIKSEFPDARHNVYAYMIGANTTRYSDDGEPAGTAGMPVLDVIRKGGFTNAVIVVTRYFGGTLLGTGGLVRAYTTAANNAVANAGIVSYEIFRTVSVSLSYGDYQKIQKLLYCPEIIIDNTEFADGVNLTLAIKEDHTDTFLHGITEQTAARAVILPLGERFDTADGSH